MDAWSRFARGNDNAAGLVRPPKTDHLVLRSDVDAAREKMLAQVSHDLRTPLNGILGFAQILEQGLDGATESTRHREYASYIAEAGRELLGRIEDLLVAAEGETEREARRMEESIAVVPLLESAVAEFAAQAERLGIALILAPSPPSCRIMSGRQDCRRMITLLLETALRGAPAGSAVEIGCRRDAGGGLAIACTDEGEPLDLDAIASAHLQSPVATGYPRGAASPSRSTAGLLALRATARRNGADLALAPSASGGLVATVTFPPHRLD